MILNLTRSVRTTLHPPIGLRSNSGGQPAPSESWTAMSRISTIYIIDDNPNVWRALARLMASAGFMWKAFPSAEEFMTHAKLEEGDCIVADISMPGMSGLDLKNHLNAARNHTPLIFLTGHDTEETRAAANEAGAAGYFRKPVDAQALLDAIQWALNKNRTLPPA